MIGYVVSVALLLLFLLTIILWTWPGGRLSYTHGWLRVSHDCNLPVAKQLHLLQSFPTYSNKNNEDNNNNNKKKIAGVV